MKRWTSLFSPLILALSFVSCRSEPKAKISLQVGPSQVFQFEPKSAFAHYFQLDGQGEELRIIIASYPIGCQDYHPPQKGDVYITVTLRNPTPSNVTPGEYPWVQIEIDEDVVLDPELKPVQSALPFVRLANEGRALPQGGKVILKNFEPQLFGLVEGTFAFRDAETGEETNTALNGDFSLRICHAQLTSVQTMPSGLQ